MNKRQCISLLIMISLISLLTVSPAMAEDVMTLQAVTATGDGGAGDGGAGDGGAEVISFITPVQELSILDRPYGILDINDYLYDPAQLWDAYNSNLLAQEIISARDKKLLGNVKVALLDTGVDTEHPELSKVVTGGIDLVNMTDGIPVDDNGHGTHVTGTIAGKNIGIARYAQIYMVKVLDQNAAGEVSTLAAAIQWCIANDMDIINMSIAFSEDNPAVHAAVQQAYAAGIIMVAAVGNHSNWIDDDDAAGDGGAGDGGAGDGGAFADATADGLYPVMYPAAYPEVIAVSAHDSYGNLAPYANTGPETDLIAPGTGVYSAGLDKTFGLCSGTSMATPHVSGALALMRAIDTHDLLKVPGEARRILKDTLFNGKIDLIGALQEVAALNDAL